MDKVRQLTRSIWPMIGVAALGNLKCSRFALGALCVVWIAFALTTIVTSSAFAGLDDVHAVISGTFGVLTKCRGWVVTTTCRTYHHTRLPHRIAVGDTIILHFGSNPKHYRFPVARIDQKAGRCVIFSEAERHQHRIDKINVPHCHRAV